MKYLIFAALFTLVLVKSLAQAPVIQWEKSLGGRNNDGATCVQQTSDSGYIMVGRSLSNDGDVTGNHGQEDYWIVKLSSSGGIQWEESLGGDSSDVAQSVQQTFDGGYIVAGTSNSNNGDVTGNHGGTDLWIVKLSSGGSIEWQKSLGGTGNDEAWSIQQTKDSGYIVAGICDSNNGDIMGNHGGLDYWVVKLTSSGSITWEKSLGGTLWDEAYSIEQTIEGGYIVTGLSGSNDGDVSGNHGGGEDYWVVKLDDTGAIQWQKCLGGSSEDDGYSVRQCSDSGYIVAGMGWSSDGDEVGCDGSQNYWVVKLSSAGSIQWHECLGGTSFDWAKSAEQTLDGGYVVAGWTFSNNGDVTGNHGYYDLWIVKLSSTGSIEWQECLGGTGDESLNYAFPGCSIKQTLDSGYILAGQSNSNDSDVSGNHGGYDCWLVKLGRTSTLGMNTLANLPATVLYPNPTACEFTIAASYPIITVSVTNLIGQTILTHDYNAETVQVDVSTLPTGIYLVKINGTEVRKFLKE